MDLLYEKYQCFQTFGQGCVQKGNPDWRDSREPFQNVLVMLFIWCDNAVSRGGQIDPQSIDTTKTKYVFLVSIKVTTMPKNGSITCQMIFEAHENYSQLQYLPFFA